MWVLISNFNWEVYKCEKDSDDFYHTDDFAFPILYSEVIWIPHQDRPFILIKAVYFPKGSERRAAATRSGPREPAHDQAVRPHEGAAHPRRSGEDQAVSTENGASSRTCRRRHRPPRPEHTQPLSIWRGPQPADPHPHGRSS